jgi:hypothetical protein
VVHIGAPYTTNGVFNGIKKVLHRNQNISALDISELGTTRTFLRGKSFKVTVN